MRAQWRWQTAEREIIITVRAPWVWAVGALGLVWYWVAPSATAVMTLAAWGGLCALASLWAYQLAHRLHATRQLRYAAMQIGDELEEVITLTNTSWLPAPWVECVDFSALPDYHFNIAREVPGHQTITWRTTARCAQRGCFRLGPWELHSGDPLGVWAVCQRYTRPQEVVVYPALAPLPPHLQPRCSRAGEHQAPHQRLPAATGLVTTTRPHQPGEPLRVVHWPTSARRGTLYAKEFEPETTATLWLIPNLAGDTPLSFDPASPAETLILLAAALAAHGLAHRFHVGLLAARPTGEWTIVPPRHTSTQLGEILRALAPLRQTPTAPPLRTVFQQVPHLFSPRSVIVPLTTTSPASWQTALPLLWHRGLQVELYQVTTTGPATSIFGDALIHQVLPGELRPWAAAYGAVRRWEFKTLGTGRAQAVQTPRAVRPL